MVQIGLKNNGVWWNVKSDIFPIKLNSEVQLSLIDEIHFKLNYEAIKLLKIALISVEKQEYIFSLLCYLKAKYDGMHTIQFN